MKWNTLLYSLLFSGLGIFSFLLLANYTNLTPQVTNTIHTPGAFVFVVATFNILGYCTLRISSWMNRLYSNNLRWKWKFIAVYIGVMLLFLLLNYGLLVAAKLMGRAENPFTFQIGGIRILLVVWLVELAAKSLTEAKNAELEKQKQEMARKQAIWEKATSVAQAGIATALAITEALPNIPLSIVIGAMGAIQVATILATPIPSYADGTKGNDRHPGGTALVGDAGKHEVIMYSGKAWITPDAPTLVDIPKGAQVFPDVDKVDISNFDMPDWDFPTFSPTYFASSSGDTIVFNDYSRLEKRVDRTNLLLMKSLKMQRQDASNRDFELYKLSKLK